ncbi:hypothetical protein HpBhutan239_02530 [Helicobacter pylori]
MKLYKRVLKLHQFRNLGKKSPMGLLLNSGFEKHGELVILVGENNVGKSNILEALKAFNDTDIKLCNENDYFKAHEFEDAVLSLEEETSRNNETIDFSCVDLKIQTKEIGEGLKEFSKTLISYPFSVFIGGFINLIMSYGVLDLFLKFYKEKLKLSAFSTKQNHNLLFKELVKHLSGSSELIKNFCQCVKEIIECNTPNKNHKTNQFFIIGKGKKYPINENFKQQFRTFRSSIISLKKKIKNSLKDLNKTKKNFERKDLKYEQALEIMFDRNNDLEIYSIHNKLFNIPKKYLQKINQESLKEIKQSKYPFNIEAKGEYNNNVWQLEFFNDKSSLLFKVNFTEILENIAEILEYNMQSRIDSSIAKEFNELLAITQDSPQDNYQLKIHVQHNNKFYDYSKKSTAYEIKLEIHDCRKSDNQKPIILSQQSTGFQWAFNFMFSFLYNVGSNFSFNKNIIYVMDEPAAHLSVPARKEFRKFLKEYAHKHNTTFVLATHDPFLVDTDHLDEIRIVEKKEEGSAIENTFNYSLKNDANRNSDALDKIKRSLGVSQNVFHNPQKHQIIFVEGTTDYCYLSAFKLYFNEREFKNDPISFTFLPISGLKDNQTNMQKTIQKLRKLDNNPIILIDDDRKDGSDPQKAKSEQFKRANEEMPDPITILQLSSCDENFKQIKDCFSANDKEKYAKNKRMKLAMAFKTRLLYSEKDDVVSEETKKNFLKLFEWIKERVKQPND